MKGGNRNTALFQGLFFLIAFIILLIFYAGIAFAGNEDLAAETTKAAAPDNEKSALPGSIWLSIKLK